MSDKDKSCDVVLRAIEHTRGRKSGSDLKSIVCYLQRVYNWSPLATCKIVEYFLRAGKLTRTKTSGCTLYSKIGMEKENKDVENKQPQEEKSSLIRLSDGNYCVSSQLVGLKTPLPVQSEQPTKKEESPPDKHQEDDGRRKGERVTRKRTVRYDPAEYIFPALKRKKKMPGFPPEVPPGEDGKVKKKRGRKPMKKKIGVQTKPNAVRKKEDLYIPPCHAAYSRPYVRKKDREGEDVSMIEVRLCSICNFSGNKTNDKMVACNGCSNQGHQNCILNSDGKNEGKWYCPDCKESEIAACAVCELSANKDSMISCDLCGESFHPLCHTPQVKPVPKTPWRCSRCPAVTTVADIASILGTPSEDSSSLTMTTTSSEDGKSISPSEMIEVKKEKDEYPGCGLFDSPDRLSDCGSGETNYSGFKSPSPLLALKTVADDLSESAGVPKSSTSGSSGGSSRRSSIIDDREVKEEPDCVNVEQENEDVILVSDAESEKESSAVCERMEIKVENLKEPDPFEGYPVDLSIPDPSAWSAKQVYEYFAQHFEETVATAFQDQDIDGQSLLLMQRSDVLKGLGFKLGVALRVLYHVKKLQIRRSNLQLLWHYQQ